MSLLSSFRRHARLIIMVLAVAAYLAVYLLLEDITSGSITAAALLPVLAAGAFWGLRAGAAAGVLAFLLNLALPALTGFMSVPESLAKGSLTGGVALVACGAFIGWMHEQRIVLRAELARRRLAERTLRSSEGRLLRIANHILDIVIYSDRQGRILYVNPAFEQLLGYPAADALGRSVLDFIHPQDRARIGQEFGAAMTGAVSEEYNWRYECRCQTAEGDTLWLETVGSFLKDGDSGEYTIIFTGRDITDRKKQETAQRESSTLVRALLDTPGDIALLVNRNGTILEINEAAARRLQETPANLIGRCVYDFSAPNNQARRTRAQQVIRSRRLLQFEENSGENSYETTIYPVFDVNGEVDQLAIFTRDVTGYKNAEHAEREQRHLAEALANTAAVLSSTLDFNEVLDHILENIERVVPYEAVEVMLLENEEVRVVRYHTHYDRPGVPELEQGVPLAALENLNNAAAVHHPVLISDTRHSPNWVTYPESVWVQSYICAPVEVQGAVVGFVNIMSSRAGFYHEVHAARLQSFAGQAAVALQNARLYSAAQRNAQTMALLNDITRSAVQAGDMGQLLATLVEKMGELFHTQGVYINRWDEEQQVPRPAATSQASPEEYLAVRFAPREPSLTASVMNSGQVIAVDDVYASPHVSPTMLTHFPERSMLGIPLIADGRKLGAVLIGYRQLHQFTPDEITLARQIGPQIALAIAKADLLETERSQRQKLARANTLITSLGLVAARVETSANVEEVLAVMGAALKSLGISCLVALGPQAQKGMTLRYISLDTRGIAVAEKLSGLSVRSFNLSQDNFLSYPTLVEERRPVFLPHMSILMKHFAGYFAVGVSEILVRSTGINVDEPCIFLPLVSKETVIGFLGMWNEELQEEDIAALSLFASQLAGALERARLHEEVQRLSITDDLCGVYNRRGLLTYGRREVERAQRFNRPLSMIMLDIDLFKQINDEHGHLAGDEALRALADTCRKLIRGVDIIGRYGGDEFIILLVESDRRQAMQVAERLCAAVKHIQLNGSNRSTPMSISCGVTLLNEKSRTFEDLINRADQALYAAKGQGRNQVYWLD